MESHYNYQKDSVENSTLVLSLANEVLNRFDIAHSKHGPTQVLNQEEKDILAGLTTIDADFFRSLNNIFFLLTAHIKHSEKNKQKTDLLSARKALLKVNLIICLYLGACKAPVDIYYDSLMKIYDYHRNTTKLYNPQELVKIIAEIKETREKIQTPKISKRAQNKSSNLTYAEQLTKLDAEVDELKLQGKSTAAKEAKIGLVAAKHAVSLTCTADAYNIYISELNQQRPTFVDALCLQNTSTLNCYQKLLTEKVDEETLEASCKALTESLAVVLQHFNTTNPLQSVCRHYLIILVRSLNAMKKQYSGTNPPKALEQFHAQLETTLRLVNHYVATSPIEAESALNVITQHFNIHLANKKRDSFEKIMLINNFQYFFYGLRLLFTQYYLQRYFNIVFSYMGNNIENNQREWTLFFQNQKTLWISLFQLIINYSDFLLNLLRQQAQLAEKNPNLYDSLLLELSHVYLELREITKNLATTPEEFKKLAEFDAFLAMQNRRCLSGIDLDAEDYLLALKKQQSEEAAPCVASRNTVYQALALNQSATNKQAQLPILELTQSPTLLTDHSSTAKETFKLALDQRKQAVDILNQAQKYKVEDTYIRLGYLIYTTTYADLLSLAIFAGQQVSLLHRKFTDNAASITLSEFELLTLLKEYYEQLENLATIVRNYIPTIESQRLIINARLDEVTSLIAAISYATLAPPSPAATAADSTVVDESSDAKKEDRKEEKNLVDTEDSNNQAVTANSKPSQLAVPPPKHNKKPQRRKHHNTAYSSAYRQALILLNAQHPTTSSDIAVVATPTAGISSDAALAPKPTKNATGPKRTAEASRANTHEIIWLSDEKKAEAMLDCLEKYTIFNFIIALSSITCVFIERGALRSLYHESTSPTPNNFNILVTMPLKQLITNELLKAHQHLPTDFLNNEPSVTIKVNGFIVTITSLEINATHDNTAIDSKLFARASSNPFTADGAVLYVNRRDLLFCSAQHRRDLDDKVLRARTELDHNNAGLTFIDTPYQFNSGHALRALGIARREGFSIADNTQHALRYCINQLSIRYEYVQRAVRYLLKKIDPMNALYDLAQYNFPLCSNSTFISSQEKLDASLASQIQNKNIEKIISLIRLGANYKQVNFQTAIKSALQPLPRLRS